MFCVCMCDDVWEAKRRKLWRKRNGREKYLLPFLQSKSATVLSQVREIFWRRTPEKAEEPHSLKHHQTQKCVYHWKKWYYDYDVMYLRHLIDVSSPHYFFSTGCWCSFALSAVVVVVSLSERDLILTDNRAAQTEGRNVLKTFSVSLLVGCFVFVSGEKHAGDCLEAKSSILRLTVGSVVRPAASSNWMAAKMSCQTGSTEHTEISWNSMWRFCEFDQTWWCSDGERNDVHAGSDRRCRHTVGISLSDRSVHTIHSYYVLVVEMWRKSDVKKNW